MGTSYAIEGLKGSGGGGIRWDSFVSAAAAAVRNAWEST